MEDEPNFSWRELGAVGPVRRSRNQTCWAYAAMGAIESIFHIANGLPAHFQRLSVQHLLDCTPGQGPRGCHVRRAYNYILNDNNGNVYTEQEYPHLGTDLRGPNCLAALKIPYGQIHNQGRVNRDEETLRQVVRRQPVAASIASFGLMPYLHQRTVIRYNAVDAGRPLNHFVLIVGYGVDENGVEYWECQNNWGPDYMEDGYFRIERNVPDSRGTAGIARGCYFPVITDHGAHEFQNVAGN